MRNRRQHIERLLAYVAFILGCVQVLLVLVSWVITAAMPEVFARSLLSPEGIRWFFGHFTSNLASPLLVWLLLGSIAWGAVRGSGVLHPDFTEYRQRFAYRLVGCELAVFAVIILLLTVVPRAILLNVMGGLLPSSFTSSLFPYLCFVATIAGMSFGWVSQQLRDLPSLLRALSGGIAEAAPLMVIYVLATQLVYSCLYLFTS